ncbi:RNase adapter RapZ [Paralimibaculum aggregatum]|uniref:RNase adapter RapZ n=1 Tax=Paralimibaculum aggregatum TaxID=3036245 RepID=A0ABQ6LQF9_9RHOB|nr:RNase adapter RapZ [Limibaculum sp. NKW23]GMG84815.1 RNase adapter RapZ [Limibaculum sp. NKW23]
MAETDPPQPQPPAPAAPEAERERPLVLIVTGMSGAGRTTAINVLDDLGYEPLNNFPLALLETVIAPAPGAGTGGPARPIAFGIETRTRGFSTRALTASLDHLRQSHGIGALLVFLDCADEVLIARFSQTRRRHPLAPAEDAATGVARERAILEEVRGRADVVIDTTDLTPHELKQEIAGRFGQGLVAGLSVSVQSFSFKRGAPHEADMVLDCRFLRNPYWDPELRALDGGDPRIQSFVSDDPLYPEFFTRLSELTLMLLPAYKAEGKAYFSIALGCTGGRHRSVAVAEALAREIEAKGWPVALRHREIERRSPGKAGA